MTYVSSPSTGTPLLRVAAVSYLNAKPLIFGLESDARLRLELDVPSHLLSGLREARADIALLPVIDYQRLPGLRVVPVGGIGCDGPTLTVRIFSRVPIERIQTLACDRDSHTSVALARVILADLHGRRPNLTDFDANAYGQPTPDVDAMLLIGDKVVVNEPARKEFPFQMDLGAAWKTLTGLPFVFAIWTARDDVHLGTLPARLAHAREEGLRHVERIILAHAIPRGWPADLARQYLTDYLKFDIGPRQLLAIKDFHRRAAAHGLIQNPPLPLRTYEVRV